MPFYLGTSAVSPNVAKAPPRVPQRTPTRPPPHPQSSPSVPVAPLGQPAVSPSQPRVSRQPPHHQPPSVINEPQLSAAGSEALSVGAGGGSVLGFLKGSAGHFMRNLREASSKVMESVSS
ncbi:unnamed protein product [Schistocephalus solidus]|uniref:Uncharacterized protein n=1 Tax=Schistocephalus solidus TaxID=70667 RepID=A0A3P7D7K3_SCHSO|nr:unnamed protein product [Schistocephalus solidus]